MAEAVAELVDNALDARINGRALRVDIAYSVREGWVRIDDDGRGMSRGELSDALVLGLSTKRDPEIGKFGLGLKTACTSLGDRFTITTARDDAHYAHVAEYDEEHFLMSGEWKLPIQRRKKSVAHGTQIVIDSARLYASLYQSLTRNLGWTFRHFLLDDVLQLSVNGIAVEPVSYEIDEKTAIPLKGVVAGREVHGWAGLLLKSSQRGWYGFSLVRQRRIVRRHEKLGFQPHPSTARVVGELHIDAFDTNNLKTDFIRETSAWRELEEWVSRQIQPVLAASRTLAHAGMLDLKIRARIEEERRRLLGDDPPSSGRRVNGRSRTRQPGESAAVDVAVGALHLQHIYALSDAAQPYVHIERVARPAEADLMIVRTNLTHPACGQVSDRSGWACHNLAEAAARELGADKQYVEMKSVILEKLLGERSLRRALTESARDFLRDADSSSVVPADVG